MRYSAKKRGRRIEIRRDKILKEPPTSIDFMKLLSFTLMPKKQDNTTSPTSYDNY